MASVQLIAAVLVIFLMSRFVQGQQLERYNVPCGHQDVVCTCVSRADVCYFELEVEELQTFTSYGLENEEIVSRRIPGDTYFLNENGFQPSIQNCSARNESECGGPCWNPGYRSLSDFGPDCSIPMTVDGNTYRLFISVNGRIPGPTLVVTEEQIVVVKVLNKLTSEGITIHWHGMHQRRSPWMDGVAFISQPPIVPGAEFDYIFTASPPGTHWYHSHAGAQRTDGLFGALIVKENDDRLMDVKQKLNIDFTEVDEHTLTFLDWQRESSLNLFVQLHSTLGFYPQKEIGVVPNESETPLYIRTRSEDNVEVGPQPYWSGLINGRGRHLSTLATKLSIFDISPGNTYRFRLIGAQSLFAYRFSIDQHKLKVIASDGHFIEPVEVEYVIIHTGERYDVLVTADQTQANYWIRAETLEAGESHSAEAILHYDAAANLDRETTYGGVSSSEWSCSAMAPCRVLNCPFKSFPQDETKCVHLNNLTALIPSNIPSTINLADQSTNQIQFFNFGFEGSSSTSAINGHNFRLPVTPYQTNMGEYEEDQENSRRSCKRCTETSPSDQCECTYVERIGGAMYNRVSPQTVVFVLSAVGLGRNNDFSHPVHLHGHSFNVLHIEHGVYDTSGTLIENTDQIICPNTMCRTPTWSSTFLNSLPIYENASSGILKDTVIVPAGGYVVIAFQADNPGYWFLHCHIESHQLEGMGVIIQEYAEDQHNAPPNNINKIGDFSWTVEDYQKVIGSTSTTTSASGGSPAGAKLEMYLVIAATLFSLVLVNLSVVVQSPKRKHF